MKKNVATATFDFLYIESFYGGFMLLYIKALAASPLFRNVTDEEIALFLQTAPFTVKKYKKNAFVAMTDEPMEGIGLMLEGSAHLIRENMLGQRAIVTDLRPSDIFGEALLFTDNPHWPASVQTNSVAEIMFFPFEAFSKPLQGVESIQSKLLVNLLHDLSVKALSLTRKVHYLTLKGMRDKLFAYFHELYRQQQSMTLTLPHNRQEMADVLNVSRPSMSRELGKLQDEKLILLDGKTVTILDPIAIEK